MPKWKEGYSVDRIIEYFKYLDIIDRNVFLYAENSMLADYLSVLWDVKVEPLNIPPPESVIGKTKNNKDIINVAY
ncbi:MAG: hypothetical protein GTO02_18590, partial [Candidatus Dadabacteria bacterium]|nr:hypothetical protein [Candidatus Dadabacteria bacterium]